jgi:hypothetical protein
LVGKRVRARWCTDATGAVVLTFHDGAKPIEFERGKAAIAVGYVVAFFISNVFTKLRLLAEYFL